MHVCMQVLCQSTIPSLLPIIEALECSLLMLSLPEVIHKMKKKEIIRSMAVLDIKRPSEKQVRKSSVFQASDFGK